MSKPPKRVAKVVQDTSTANPRREGESTKDYIRRLDTLITHNLKILNQKGTKH